MDIVFANKSDAASPTEGKTHPDLYSSSVPVGRIFRVEGKSGILLHRYRVSTCISLILPKESPHGGLVTKL